MAINLYFRKIAIFFICQCQITPVNYFLQLLLLKMQKKEDDYFLVTLTFFLFGFLADIKGELLRQTLVKHLQHHIIYCGQAKSNQST